jgi:hypothetical protein
MQQNSNPLTATHLKTLASIGKNAGVTITPPSQSSSEDEVISYLTQLNSCLQIALLAKRVQARVR